MSEEMPMNRNCLYSLGTSSSRGVSLNFGDGGRSHAPSCPMALFLRHCGDRENRLQDHLRAVLDFDSLTWLSLSCNPGELASVFESIPNQY
jgi:hypothetical protein